MNTRTACIALVLGLRAITLSGAESPLRQDLNGPAYEFASVRWMGDKTTIIWPDGTAQKVIPFGGIRRPEALDQRAWYLTGAINIMGKRGFELAHFKDDDVIMKRLVAQKKD